MFCGMRLFMLLCIIGLALLTYLLTYLPTYLLNLFKRLHIEPLDTYYHRRILRWAGHVSRMPMSRAPRKLLTGWVANSRPIGCPQMTWGRTLKKALLCNGLSSEFTKWRELAANRDQWRVICGSTSRHTKNKAQLITSRQAIWTELRNGS